MLGGIFMGLQFFRYLSCKKLIIFSVGRNPLRKKTPELSCYCVASDNQYSHPNFPHPVYLCNYWNGIVFIFETQHLA